MTYYHVYICTIDRKGKEKSSLSYDIPSKKLLIEHITTPFLKNKKFFCLGEVVDPSKITRIAIFKSEKKFNEMILPNGKSPLEKSNTYVIDCFFNRLVNGVIPCTPKFISAPLLEELKETRPYTKPLGKKEKMFIVHGRDETQALRLQKYLKDKLKADAEMFEDFKERSGSNTIIEQLEYIKDNVGYAFVIVTPDDLGCLREDIEKCRTKMLIGKKSITVNSVCEILDKLNTRTRQNVVFEHGLFIGALGRGRVCCLFQEETKEKPSDIDGILYVKFKKSVKETFPEITEKLKNVGLVKT